MTASEAGVAAGIAEAGAEEAVCLEPFSDDSLLLRPRSFFFCLRFLLPVSVAATCVDAPAAAACVVLLGSLDTAMAIFCAGSISEPQITKLVRLHVVAARKTNWLHCVQGASAALFVPFVG